MSLKARVYLCGPITGQSPAKSPGWREYAEKKLVAAGIGVLDPTRSVMDTSVGSETELGFEGQLGRLRHGRSTIQRDRFDVVRCDLVLANFLGSTLEAGGRVSIGSVGELFWADAFRKPIVLVREESHNIHDHAMLNDLAGWIFSDLDVALAAIGRILV
jgi:hypothetical protein